jgi:glyoxylase-like metal-dependent hydrolase (beta-lactamase superfamily II)
MSLGVAIFAFAAFTLGAPSASAHHTAGHQSLRVRLDSGEVVLTADSCYMRKALDEMIFPPFAHSYDAMRTVMARYRAMERAGARLIFGHDAGQWRDDGSLAISLGS